MITKTTPHAFFAADLDAALKEKDIDHIYIYGFNAEYGCLFSAIADMTEAIK